MTEAGFIVFRMSVGIVIMTLVFDISSSGKYAP